MILDTCPLNARSKSPLTEPRASVSPSMASLGCACYNRSHAARDEQNPRQHSTEMAGSIQVVALDGRCQRLATKLPQALEVGRMLSAMLRPSLVRARLERLKSLGHCEQIPPWRNYWSPQKTNCPSAWERIPKNFTRHRAFRGGPITFAGFSLIQPP